MILVAKHDLCLPGFHKLHTFIVQTFLKLCKLNQNNKYCLNQIVSPRCYNILNDYTVWVQMPNSFVTSAFNHTVKVFNFYAYTIWVFNSLHIPKKSSPFHFPNTLAFIVLLRQ